MGLAPLKQVDIMASFKLAAAQDERDFDSVAAKLGKLFERGLGEHEVQFNVELGTYINCNAVHMVSRIIGTKVVGDTNHYYINNGIYKGYMARQFNDDTMVM